MAAVFTFYLINSYIDTSLSTATITGFNSYTQQDCIFVNKPFYVIMDMMDLYGNKIASTDSGAYLNYISS
jgi:hypothetical protein